MTLLPARGTVKGKGVLTPGEARNVAIWSPFMRTVTWAGVLVARPSSTTRKVSSCSSLTMPKRGARTTSTRRSNSSGCPVIRPWTGALKPSS
ncbi:hypothetical protein D3C80_1399210 [compost metagenome]